jgi:P27 family predicted phage terminase small subunit
MTRGRKPKPSYLRVLDGTDAKAKHARPEEPQPDGELRAPPHWLTERQKDLWRSALATVPPGLLRELDSSVFTVWVVASDAHSEAAQKVAQFGQMVKSPVTGTPMQSPYVSIMNKQAQLMLKAAAEMGFTPSSRTRVKVQKKKPGTGSPFGDLKSLSDD